MAELTEKSQRGSFDGWVKVIFIAGMLVFAFHASTHMVAAGDTWVAMACGRHFDNHKVDTIEPFSANSHKAGPTEADIRRWPGWAQSIAGKLDIETVQKWHPTGWVNQNWLTHLIFYKLATFGQPEGEYNYNALIWWKFSIYFIGAFCIYYTARLMGTSVPGSAFAGAMALFIGRSFLDVRPAGYANILVAVYLMVLAMTVYKDYRWVWLTIPVTVFWANVHGGYIYVFIMMVPFIGLNFITIPFKQRFRSIGLKGLYHSAGASVAAFIAMVIFNPFKLTNLTHTFEISLSTHAESWRKVNEWHPAFEWDNPVGDEIPFLIMFILAWIAFMVWLAVWAFAKPVPTGKRGRKSQGYIAPKSGEYEWPKVNLAALVIAALTVYMAVKSRRFIPIGAIAACPVILLLVEQAIAMIRVKIRFGAGQKLVLPKLPSDVRWIVIGFGVAMLVVFGGWWGAKYHRIYIGPWPNDLTHEYNPEKRDSVFMRMTASNVKPFDVCQFVRENNVSGRMFNYWTEGGALAFGQTPDPETGKTPLQLFMDGRAQAAYNHDKFTLWQGIYAGGPYAGRVRASNRMATSKEIGEIGDWLDTVMKKDNIWVFILPNSQFAPDKDPRRVNYFPLALSRHKDWRMVYMDDNQQMFIDTSTEKGLKLVTEVFNGTAKFPNEYAKNLVLSQMYLSSRAKDAYSKGPDLAKKAFELNPSFISARTLIRIASGAYVNIAPDVREDMREYVEKYVTNFVSNNESLKKQPGYGKELSAANTIAGYLGKYYQRSNKELAMEYKMQAEEWLDERKRISYAARW